MLLISWFYVDLSSAVDETLKYFFWELILTFQTSKWFKSTFDYSLQNLCLVLGPKKVWKKLFLLAQSLYPILLSIRLTLNYRSLTSKGLNWLNYVLKIWLDFFHLSTSNLNAMTKYLRMQRLKISNSNFTLGLKRPSRIWRSNFRKV